MLDEIYLDNLQMQCFSPHTQDQLFSGSTSYHLSAEYEPQSSEMLISVIGVLIWANQTWY